VQALVAFGPRTPGSEGIEKARNYIIENLERNRWKITRQTFVDDTPRGKVTFSNLIARFPSGSGPSAAPGEFLLLSHYDTKVFDEFQFVGANDGGSSTGALIEMARVLSLHPALARRIEIVFLDGEEAFERFSETDGLYGSRYYAKHLRDARRVDSVRGGILWDMIGDRSLTITLPPDSPPQLARGIFSSAEFLKVRNHFTYSTGGIMDDHTPLNKVGIPTIDLIDFEYPAWHTAADTMEQLSAESLKTVGAVTAHYLAESAFK
jgi:Zn-dependent M28 family amino/carboxypeptidase